MADFLLIIKENYFVSNVGTLDGASIFISNANSETNIQISNNIFENNLIDYIEKNGLHGSTIYLINPGSINITNSIFQNNSGIIGACLYYSETNSLKILNLTGNSFIKNFARYGAAVYLANKFNEINIFDTNLFFHNYAIYGTNDTGSPPFRLKLCKSQNCDKFYQKSLSSFSMIPGISNITLNFEIVDYYGQAINYYNGSYALLELEDTSHLSKLVTVEGINYVIIINGQFISL